LLRQEESSQRRRRPPGRRRLRRSLALLATGGGCGTRGYAPQTVLALFPPAAALLSASQGDPKGVPGPDTVLKTKCYGRPEKRAKIKIRRFSTDVLPGPLGGAEQRRKAGGFRRGLSEGRSPEFRSRPAFRVAQGTRAAGADPGSPSSLLTFFLATQEESKTRLKRGKQGFRKGTQQQPTQPPPPALIYNPRFAFGTTTVTTPLFESSITSLPLLNAARCATSTPSTPTRCSSSPPTACPPSTSSCRIRFRARVKCSPPWPTSGSPEARPHRPQPAHRHRPRNRGRRRRA
jgi:hypothetical protein